MSLSVELILLACLLFALLALGQWVFSTLIIVAIAGLYFISDLSPYRVVSAAQLVLWRSVSSWELAALPLFIWMGEILYRTDIPERMFNGLSHFVRRLPGGLVHANIFGCAFFAAVSGSSAATTATVGKFTLPELTRRGYPKHLVLGSLAGSGCLGLMIPPSIVMIIYGVIAQVSISKLFIAGFLPGLLIAALFVAYVAARSMIVGEEGREQVAASRLRDALRQLLPLLAIIAITMSLLYSGIATPSEVAAVGVCASFAVAAVLRQFSLDLVLKSAESAIRSSCVLCIIVMAASFLTTASGYMNLPRTFLSGLEGFDLGPYELILAIFVFYLALGCFLDGLSMVVVTTAVMLPAITHAGFDPLWFGIFLVVTTEIAQITPPVGFNLFVIRGITGEPIMTVARSAVPFFLLMALAAAILTLVPELATWLPDALV